MKIVADSHIPYVKEYFQIYGDLILRSGRIIAPSDVKDADILLVRSITHVDEKLLAGSQVKFVGSVTAGIDHIDTKWLKDAGIALSVATGFNSPPVADYVVSVIAALQRKRLLGQANVKAAIIGVGNVGRLVLERLKSLNIDVTLCDPVRADQDEDFARVNVPLEELSDFDLISLHVPLTRLGAHPTHHFINQDFLKKQKPGCVLLNASRGAVIDSQALLTHGMHLLWCFDVWENEPRINKAVLEQACIATPHIAGYSVQSKIRGIDMIYQLACEKKIIAPQAITPINMPCQQLAFAGVNHHWQDIVLGAFNPLILTAMMKTTLLPSNDYGHLFDEMRNQFNYRHELGYTVVDAQLNDEEKCLLEKLGVTFKQSVAH